jgi:hypothetical protein
MSQEQKDILKMLADGVIDVDEAERLLKAVDSHHDKKTGRSEHSFEKGMNNFSETLREGLEGLGGFINDVIHQTGVNDLDFNWQGFQNHSVDDSEHGRSFFNEDVITAKENDMSISLPAETKIVVSCTAGGNVTLAESSDDSIKWHSESSKSVRYIKKSSKFILLLPAGNFKVSIPSDSQYVKVSSMGGDIVSCGIPVESKYKTMGGTITLKNVKEGFSAMTMGGSVLAELSESFSSEGKLKTHGGCITLKYPEKFGVRVSASTMAGKINFSGDFKVASRKQGFAVSSLKGMTAEAEEGSPVPEVKLKTMAGDIYIMKGLSDNNDQGASSDE